MYPPGAKRRRLSSMILMGWYILCVFVYVFACLCVFAFVCLCVCVFVVHAYVPPNWYIRIHTQKNALSNIQTHTVYTNTHAERKAFLSTELDGLV